MKLGWYEGEGVSGEPEYVNLDLCWRLTVARSNGFDGGYAVWGWFGDKGVMLAGTKGTLDEATTYLREIFENEETDDEG